MHNIAGFAFKGNISSSMLKGLNLETKFYLPSENQEIEKFVLKLLDTKPKYILGMGMYSGVDRDKLRIESHFNLNGKRLKINNFLVPGKITKLASRIGNSYCNHVSAQIMDLINKNRLDTKYTFIHIPWTFLINDGVKEIEDMLLKLEVK